MNDFQFNWRNQTPQTLNNNQAQMSMLGMNQPAATNPSLSLGMMTAGKEVGPEYEQMKQRGYDEFNWDNMHSPELNNLKTQLSNLEAERAKLVEEKSKLKSYLDPDKKNAMMEANRARRFRKDNESLMQYRWRKEQDAAAENRAYQKSMHEQVARTAKEGRFQSAYDMAARGKAEALNKAAVLPEGDQKNFLMIEASKYDQQMKDLLKQASQDNIQIAAGNVSSEQPVQTTAAPTATPEKPAIDYMSMSDDEFAKQEDAIKNDSRLQQQYDEAKAARGAMRSSALDIWRSKGQLTPEMKAAGYEIKQNAPVWSKNDIEDATKYYQKFHPGVKPSETTIDTILKNQGKKKVNGGSTLMFKGKAVK